MPRRGKFVRTIEGKVRLNRMTPEVLGELIAIHAQCVLDQLGKCTLTLFLKPLCWELNQFFGVGNPEDNGFRRVNPMCAAKPLRSEHGDVRSDSSGSESEGREE